MKCFDGSARLFSLQRLLSIHVIWCEAHTWSQFVCPDHPLVSWLCEVAWAAFLTWWGFVLGGGLAEGLTKTFSLVDIFVAVCCSGFVCFGDRE